MSTASRHRRRTVLRGAAAIVAAAALPGGLRALAQPAASFAGTQAGDRIQLGGLAFCWCPPGAFRMGSPAGEPDRRPDEAQVDVSFGLGFWMGRHEVTQAQWSAAMGAFPGELSAGAGADFPVYNMNFAEAEDFCDRLTARERGSGALPPDWEVRLPTEAQWEYACRAGTLTATAFGDQLSSRQANFRGDVPYNGAPVGPVLGQTATVGSYPANAWGLHDMHGNLFEWCRDWYHARLPGGADPDLHRALNTAQPNGDGTYSRVRRGGCWSDEGWACRSATRLRFEPERRADHIGLRVVLVQV